jgi:hypothetical protein
MGIGHFLVAVLLLLAISAPEQGRGGHSLYGS